MKALLTGITGNLGFEIAHSLNQREVKVLPIVRNTSSLKNLGLVVEDFIEADLTDNSRAINPNGIDCIIHSAGNVHFEKSGDTNTKMMSSIIAIAKNLKVPIYYVSTAFLWREPEPKNKPRNAYEKDKYRAEEILRHSDVRHTIFRPSVLVGSSETGRLQNWSGYYLLVNKFLESAQTENEAKVRFPNLSLIHISEPTRPY